MQSKLCESPAMSDHKWREAIAFYTSSFPFSPRNGMGAITSPKNRFSGPRYASRGRFVCRAGSRLLTCTRVRAVSARGYRSTVQYRFFRNAGHTQGKPAEKRLTVNRDALPSDNIIQFREPAADRFRGNCVPTDRYVLRLRRSSQS